MYSERLLERFDKDPFYVRVPAGTTFYLYVTQTVDLGKASVQACSLRVLSFANHLRRLFIIVATPSSA